jgi:hypothetical protein
MDEVKFLPFGENGITLIGTAQLNECSVVMIVSTYGAILGHIPPNSLDDSMELDLSDCHARSKMSEVEALYQSNSSYFALGGNNWILCAVIHRNVALLTHQAIMEDSLKRLGLSYSLPTYAVGRISKGALSTGTCFIDGSGKVLVVYVEDKVISGGASWPQSTQDFSMAKSSGY